MSKVESGEVSETTRLIARKRRHGTLTTHNNEGAGRTAMIEDEASDERFHLLGQGSLLKECKLLILSCPTHSYFCPSGT